MLTGISMTGEGGRWPVDEKKMTLGELIGWLDSNDVSYEIDDAGRLTVKGDLKDDFRHWVKTRKYTGLPDEFVRVNRDLWLEQTSIVSLGGLTSVARKLNLAKTPITSLGNLTSVGGSLDLRNTPITYLDNLISVGESLVLAETPITSLSNLTSAGGWLYLHDTLLTSLGNLTSVGKNLVLAETPIISLGNLTSVGGNLNLLNTSITSLGNLISIVWGLDLQGTPLTSLDNLPQVGGDLHLDQSQFQLLTREALQKVKGKIRYRGQATERWVTLSPAELETIVAENERRESLHSVRESDVNWDLYDR